jgi:Flagellar hook-length control protein FliK
MTGTSPPLAASPTPAHAQQNLRKGSKADTSFHDLLAGGPEIRDPRPPSTALPEHDPCSDEAAAGLPGALMGAQAPERKLLPQFGSAPGRDQSESPASESAFAIDRSSPSGPSGVISSEPGKAAGADALPRVQQPAGLPARPPLAQMKPAPGRQFSANTLPHSLSWLDASLDGRRSAQVQTPGQELPPSPEPQPKTPPALRKTDGRPGSPKPVAPENETEGHQAPEPIEKLIDKSDLPVAEQLDPAALGMLLQAPPYVEPVSASNPGCETGESGRTVSPLRQPSLPEAPKIRISRPHGQSLVAASGAELDEVKKTVNIAADEVSAPIAPTRADGSPVPHSSGPERAAALPLEAPMAASGALVMPPAPGVFALSASAQAVLNLVEPMIKGSSVLAPSPPLHSDPRISLQGGQAGSLKFKLHPVELGEVKVTMRVRNESVFIDIAVENAQAYEFLAREGDAMVAKFAALGLHLNQITIQNNETGGNSSGQNPQESGASNGKDAGQRYEPRQAPRDQNVGSYADDIEPDRNIDRTEISTRQELNQSNINGTTHYI